jgi:23S rRNA pseudouridine1911/1915/1917 synthase
MPERLALTVPPAAEGTRADRFAADVSGLSRARVQRLIAAGHLTQGGRRIRSSEPLAAGAVLELEVPDAPSPEPQPEPGIELEVVYEDPDLLIVDKPAGLVVHPAPGHASGTLVNALLARPGGYGTMSGPQRPGIVHRLDRDTSGLLMIARHDRAQAWLIEQLRARRVKKTYLGLVWGEPPAAAGRIEAPLGRDPDHRTRMAVVADGRPSVSGYRVRERLNGWTLLELDLVTGRTHQLRVHLASIGHPLAGDTVYASGAARRGPLGLDRLFLHAWRLELEAPSGKRHVQARAPLPPELEAVLESLRGGPARRGER